MNKQVMDKPAGHSEPYNATKVCTQCGAHVAARQPCHNCGGRSQVGSATQVGYSTNYDRF
jgi:hypothetical protein